MRAIDESVIPCRSRPHREHLLAGTARMFPNGRIEAYCPEALTASGRSTARGVSPSGRL